MEQVGLIVLGSVIGALATGGVGVYVEHRREGLARKVAARLILGDLFLLGAWAAYIAKRAEWLDVDWKAPLETWRGSRDAFAASVEAWEWAVVDNAFRVLANVATKASYQEQPDSEALAELTRLDQSLPQAREIVLPHAADDREQVKLVEELKRLGYRASTGT